MFDLLYFVFIHGIMAQKTCDGCELTELKFIIIKVFKIKNLLVNF